MPTLLHLNGAPGIGKSTIARRFAAEHPGTLNCDIDVLRTMVGGWEDDFGGTGELIRPVALAMIGAHLRNGHDVVLPQMLARESELTRFREVAEATGAVYCHVVLVAPVDQVVDRFYQRPVSEPLAEQVRGIVDAAGGRSAIAEFHDALTVIAGRAGTHVVSSMSDDVAETYGAVLEALRAASWSSR